MAGGFIASKIHLRVTILPPADVDDPPDPISFLLNLEPEVTFLAGWNLIQSRYEQNYIRPKDWSFKKIQDAWGADISLSDTVGDIFAGETREKCVVNVLTIQSHREDTVPEGSFLQPPRPRRSSSDVLEAERLRDQEARYGSVVDQLNPDRPVPSSERDLGSAEHQLRDSDGSVIPQLPEKAPEAAVEKPDAPPAVPHIVQKTPQTRRQPVSSPNIAIPDITVEDPIEDDSQPPRGPTVTPQQALDNLRRRRISRGENPDLREPPNKPVSKEQLTSVWSVDDDRLFVRAIRDGQDWTTLHSRRFPLRTLDAVRHHFVEMRKKLEIEDAAFFCKRRVAELSSQGYTPSKSGEKWQEHEDDLLLAARIYNVEIKRVAKDHFPLRNPDQVTARAKHVYNNATRKAIKATNSQRPPQSSPTPTEPSIEQVLATFNPDLRARIENQRLRLREDVLKFSADRDRESQLSQNISQSKESTKKFKERTRKSIEYLSLLEQEKAKDDDVKARRLAEDLKNNELYSREYAAWYAQKEADEAAGRPTTAPCPKRPAGSLIGTEIATSSKSHSKSVYPSPTRTSSVSNEPTGAGGNTRTRQVSTQQVSKQPQEQAVQASSKRTSSTLVEVRVSPPPAKKQKTDGHSTSTAPTISDAALQDTPSKKRKPDGPPAATAPAIPNTLLPEKIALGHFPARHFLNSSFASRHDLERAGAEQAAPKQSTYVAASTSLNPTSSPLQAKTPGSGSTIRKKTRQTTLPFAKPPLTGRRPEARASSNILTSSVSRRLVPDSELLSSDDSSSYSDSDINDEDLTELADRSSEVFRSSPPGGARVSEGVQTVTPRANGRAAPGVGQSSRPATPHAARVQRMRTQTPRASATTSNAGPASRVKGKAPAIVIDEDDTATPRAPVQHVESEISGMKDINDNVAASSARPVSRAKGKAPAKVSDAVETAVPRARAQPVESTKATNVPATSSVGPAPLAQNQTRPLRTAVAVVIPVPKSTNATVRNPVGKQTPAKASASQRKTAGSAGLSATKTPTTRNKSQGNDKQILGAHRLTPIVIVDEPEAIVIPDDDESEEATTVKPEPTPTKSSKRQPSKVRASDLVEREVQAIGSQGPTPAPEPRGRGKSVGRVSKILDSVQTGLIKVAGIVPDGVKDSSTNESGSNSSHSNQANAGEREITVPDSRRPSMNTEELIADAPTSAQKPRKPLSNASAPSNGNDNDDAASIEEIQRTIPIPQANTIRPSGQPSTIALYEDESDVEDIDPADLRRVPNSPSSLDSDEEMMDMDDAREYAAQRGQFFQGEPPKTNFRFPSPPPLVPQPRRGNVLSSQMPDEASPFAATFGMDVRAGGAGVGGHGQGYPYEPTTQDLAPPFPSSGQTRASLRNESQFSQHQDYRLRSLSPRAMTSGRAQGSADAELSDGETRQQQPKRRRRSSGPATTNDKFTDTLPDNLTTKDTTTTGKTNNSNKIDAGADKLAKLASLRSSRRESSSWRDHLLSSRGRGHGLDDGVGAGDKASSSAAAAAAAAAGVKKGGGEGGGGNRRGRRVEAKREKGERVAEEKGKGGGKGVGKGVKNGGVVKKKKSNREREKERQKKRKEKERKRAGAAKNAAVKT